MARTVIEFGARPFRATINNGRWRSDEAGIARLCETFAAPGPEFPGYEPDADYAAADRVAKALGGRIVEYDGPPDKDAPPGRIY